MGIYMKNQKAAGATLNKWSKSLMVAGWRIGWLSFRLVFVGKMLMRWLMVPVKKTIDILTNWEKGLDKVAMTLGLLEAQGMASGDMTKFLTETMEKLPGVGLEFQAAMGALESVLIGIAVDIGPTLSATLLELAEAFLDVWNEVSPVLIPALQELKDTVLPPLLDLIRDMGPALVMSFVSGLRTAIPMLVGFLYILKPILPVIAGIIGFLMPFAPLLILVGTALYFLSPILIAVALVFKGLAFVLPVFAGGLKAVGIGLGAMAATGSVAIPILLTLSVAALAVAGAIIAVVAAVAFLTGQWGTFTDGVAKVVGALGSLCFKHVTPQVETFTGALQESNAEIGRTVRDVSSLSRSLRGMPEAGVGIGGGVGGARIGGGPTTQYITVEAPITIESITAEVDLDAVQDKVSEGIVEAMRRKRY